MKELGELSYGSGVDFLRRLPKAIPPETDPTKITMKMMKIIIIMTMKMNKIKTIQKRVELSRQQQIKRRRIKKREPPMEPPTMPAILLVDDGDGGEEHEPSDKIPLQISQELISELKY